MRRIIASALAICLLAGCSKGGKALTPEERTDLYETAITAARDEETNEFNPLVTQSDDDRAELMFSLLGFGADDLSAYAISVSAINVRAYGVAALMPAAGKEDTVLEGCQGFIDTQKQNFQNYLADQYELAVNTRLETLEDGTILMVMCEGQDAVFDAIRDTIEAGG